MINLAYGGSAIANARSLCLAQLVYGNRRLHGQDQINTGGSLECYSRLRERSEVLSMVKITNVIAGADRLQSSQARRSHEDGCVRERSDLQSARHRRRDGQFGGGCGDAPVFLNTTDTVLGSGDWRWCPR